MANNNHISNTVIIDWDLKLEVHEILYVCGVVSCNSIIQNFRFYGSDFSGQVIPKKYSEFKSICQLSKCYS